MEMRALSVRQPWASLIMAGLKRIETRSQTTHRRGRILIHASITMGPAERAAAIREGLDPDTLPRGAILGSAEIVNSNPVEDLHVSEDERRRGDHTPGRWGWELDKVQAFDEPIPCAGALSFWSVPKAAADLVAAQLDARDLVFVYGTLKRGHGNHRVIADGSFLGEDRIPAVMHDLGAFPAVRLDAAATVYGEVFSVDPQTLARLDRLEGHPTFYQRTRVRMSSGRRAWVYVMEADKLAQRTRIRSGRWEQRK
jgi:gamma-glutamylcyclotransferase (GGCT)/AIG2-like uncharacterized protein YtfP